MRSPFAAVLDRRVLIELAGQRFFERGENYYRSGLVRSLIEHEGYIAARVLGTHEYRVRFRIEDEELFYSCTCPVGADRLFCKHCVAVGLAWLEGGVGESQSGEPALTNLDEVRDFLQEQEKDELVRIVVEQAMEDERLHERLLMWAASERVEGVDLSTFRWVIDRAFDPGDLLDYGPVHDYVRGIEEVIESIAGLLEEGFAKEVIELSEYALGAAERAMDYAPDMMGAAHELEELHHAACQKAELNSEKLAKRLLEWELHGHYDIFFEAANSYADVLGEEGLAEYSRLAEDQWAQIPALGPGDKDPHRHGRRFRITHIMETLARQAGDVEDLVGVLQRDLSAPHQYLRIARIYEEAGQGEKALEWAEEAMWVFPDSRQPGLREFVAQRYHHRGRHEEATELIWPHFAHSPRLESYRELKEHAGRAGRAGRWEKWRNKALGFLREDIARRIEESKQSYFSLPVDHSELVRIFLWEGSVEAAWCEAQEGGCSEELWLELAAWRAEDHPQEALEIYWSRIEPLVEHTNNAAYEQAYGLLVKVRHLMWRLGREEEFEEYLQLLRAEYKRKRNFMKLLEAIG